MACNYCVKNRKPREIYITERHIQALWLEQKYFSALFTSQKKSLKIISPGLWNLGAGPDFQKAHILIDGQSFYGDIELHLNEGCWFQHQHHKDERYNNVILHVVLWQPINEQLIVTENQHTVASVYLEPFLTVPIEKLSQRIDLELYPYKHFVGAGRCADELFKHISTEQAAQFFQNAADLRLEKKRLVLQSKIPNACDYLVGGIAMALGFKNNAHAFLDLFLELKHKKFKTEPEALAWLLGKCGFFQERFQAKWQNNVFYQQLANLYAIHADPIIMPLILTQIRPLNHPIRRLVLMVKMHGDTQLKFLLATAEMLWQHYYMAKPSKRKASVFLKQLMNLLPNYTDTYWNKHYLFEQHDAKTEVPLLGPDLKREIVLNVLFPLLAEKIFKRSYDERENFRQCYYSIPAAKAGKTNYLRHRFFGNSPKGNLLKHAYHTQGAYQIHHDYCVHYEASCEGCPFVEQHKAASCYQPARSCTCT